MSPPPLSREERGRRQELDTGAPRAQGPEETALAPGATPPPEDADLGGAARPAQVEEGRAIVAFSATPEAPMAGGGAMPDGARAPYSGPTLTT